MNPNLEEQVVEFVRRTTGTTNKHISAATTLNHDLGIDGDDAAEFLAAFGEEFQVDLATFPYDDYFGPEAGCNPFVSPILWLFDRPKSLRIDELVTAARDGRWPPSN